MADGRILPGQAQAFNEQQRRRALELKFKELEDKLTVQFAGQFAELERRLQLLAMQVQEPMEAPVPVAQVVRKR